MASYRIVQIGDNILRQKAAQVRRFNDNLHNLLDNMTITLKEADGVGLAAPQVGVSKQVVVINGTNGIIELVNPVLVRAEGREEDEEGCLSVPDRQGYVPRATYVEVKAQDRNGKEIIVKGEGLIARCMQHEIDHLHGILFIDRMTREIK